MLLSPDRALGRNLDPLDAADGGTSVRVAPRVAFSLHPQATLVDAPVVGEAPRISAPVRKAAPGVVASIVKAPPIPWDGAHPMPEDVTPLPVPPPVADPAVPARPTIPGRKAAEAADAAATRDAVGFLAVVAVVVILLSR